MQFSLKQQLVGSTPYWWYKKARARFAKQRYNDPTADMVLIGVTGTDGKTTTCNLIHWILQQTAGPTLFVGTTGVKIGRDRLTGVEKMTSYDPMDFQRIATKARQHGCNYGVIEVSSHGLDQLRFHGITFAAGVLTNIAKEHLDYHGSFATYLAAKKKLFTYVADGAVDQKLLVLPSNQQIVHGWRQDYQSTPQVRYGLAGDDEVHAEDISYQKNTTSFTCVSEDERVAVTFPMVGEFNVRNALAALGAVRIAGVPLADAAEALAKFPGIAGRQEHYYEAGVDWYIDFAHTPYGLQGVLSYLLQIKGDGKLWCLFGAPGMRDPYKRPAMGRIVDQLADCMVVTDDDADQEDRYEIIEDITAGIERKEGPTYQIIPDRREAIQYVVDHVQPGDVVLLAGKGHEQVLVTNEGKIPRSDKEVLYDALKDSSHTTVT